MKGTLDDFRTFRLSETPPVESYTFRGDSFVHWFNITFVCGRVIVTGDCGDNVFVVGGSNEELKKWLLEVDKDYALGKSRQTKEYYDPEYAEKRVREHLSQMEFAPSSKWFSNEEEILGQLDFLDWFSLMKSIEAFDGDPNSRIEVFPNWWEMGSIFHIWSPYQEMQYKQLLFAGRWFEQQRLVCVKCGRTPKDFEGVVAFVVGPPILCENCMEAKPEAGGEVVHGR